ncbi:MAG: uracil-DNA glycosylase family protein [Thermoplasmata archaeon]
MTELKGIAACFENILRDWEARRMGSSACHNCPLSHQTNGPVLGVGNRTNPRIMAVGESPNEEQQTEVKSVREVKEFLDRYWEKAESSSSRGWKKMARLMRQIFEDLPDGRESVYLTNVCKCASNALDDHPEQNAISFEICSAHLRKEIDCVNPKLMVVFGEKALNGLHDCLHRMDPAAGAVLDEAVVGSESFSDIEGEPIPIPKRGYTILPVYHWSRGESFSSTQDKGDYPNRIRGIIASLLGNS